jgi:hypothetical protein
VLAAVKGGLRPSASRQTLDCRCARAKSIGQLGMGLLDRGIGPRSSGPTETMLFGHAHGPPPGELGWPGLRAPQAEAGPLRSDAFPTLDLTQLPSVP